MEQPPKVWEHKRNPDAKLLRVLVSPTLYAPIAEVGKRHRNMSITLRILLTIGLKEYKRRALYGIIRKPQREEYEARCEAVAQSIQQERQSRTSGKKQQVTPALAVITGLEQEKINT